MPETKTQHWQRGGQELNKMTKGQLCTLYRQMGGLGGTHPPEKWTKEEVVHSVVDMEWSRLPEEQKLPDPPRLTPPCDTCGKGENATAHRYGGDHHWTNTFDPDQKWVPESEAEEKRLTDLFSVGES
ncbi:hypothetical protein [Streptomyces kronopolitis]|uniref:hypothetical protein n=1 Tax=Streptomyces kronopolitis TaxID=1612435 RepID=UPI003D991DBE